jgi:hypothetical protein
MRSLIGRSQGAAHQNPGPLVSLPKGFRVIRRTCLFLSTLCLISVASSAVTPTSSSEEVAVQLRDQVTAGQSVAFSWVSELTTRIGPRPAGSLNDNEAGAWAAKKLTELGFENVRIENFPFRRSRCIPIYPTTSICITARTIRWTRSIARASTRMWPRGRPSRGWPPIAMQISAAQGLRKRRAHRSVIC